MDDNVTEYFKIRMKMIYIIVELGGGLLEAGEELESFE